VRVWGNLNQQGQKKTRGGSEKNLVPKKKTTNGWGREDGKKQGEVQLGPAHSSNGNE